MREGSFSAGCGSTHLSNVHGVGVRRDSAPYSACNRHCTTSNCSGPTAASRVAPGGALRALNDWTTPSCKSCSKPARYFFASDELGFEMYVNTSGGKRGISSYAI